MKRSMSWIFGGGSVLGVAALAVAALGVVPGFALGGSGSAPAAVSDSQPADGFHFKFTAIVDGTVVQLKEDTESLAPPIFASFPTGYAEPAADADTDVGHADFSQAEATRRLNIVAGAIATELFGSEVKDPETRTMRPPFQVDGHPVSLDDLELKEFRFIPSATSYTTVANTSGGFSEPTDAWIAVWERDGVTTPGRPTADLSIVIVMEDATGAIHSVQAGAPNSAS